MREPAALLEARVPSATSRRSDTPTRRVLPPRRIYQVIADALAQRINAEEWPDGFALPSERALCRQFSASRTAVREALAALQASGLIAIRQRSRARVTLLRNPAVFEQLSGTARHLLPRPRGVADFQEARVLFECGLARYAARHASPKEIERLRVALADNKKALFDSRAFARTDVAFHDVLADIPRNPLFTSLNGALAAWLMEQRIVSMRAPVRGARRRAYAGHVAIYEAIAAHDVEAADSAMAAHLHDVIVLYGKAIALKRRSGRHATSHAR